VRGFDPEQAQAHIRALDHPRFPGGDEEGRAAEYLAGQLARFGWDVKGHDVVFSRFPELLAERLRWPAIGLAMTAQTTLASRGAHVSAWLACEAVALLCWLLPAFRLGSGLPPQVRARNLVATGSIEPPQQSRVVFLADLDCERPHWPRQARQLLALLIITMIVLISFANLSVSVRPSGSMRVGFLAFLWLLLLARACDGLIPRGLTAADNRAGLAVLLELARTLPRSLQERVEIGFVASALASIEPAGARTLSRWLATLWTEKPTLYFQLIDPEPRKELFLLGDWHALRLAESAAKGLWIPHRVTRAAWLRRRVESITARVPGASSVCLIGDMALERERLWARGSRAEYESDHAALGLAAQLATEIAMRWARQQDQIDPGASAARSSQKPG
jgi:hypothetical protein